MSSTETPGRKVLRYVLVVGCLVGLFGPVVVWLSGLGNEQDAVHALPVCAGQTGQAGQANDQCLEARAGDFGDTSRSARKKGKYSFVTEDGKKHSIKLKGVLALDGKLVGLFHDGDLVAVQDESGKRASEKFSPWGIPPIGSILLAVLLLVGFFACAAGINILNKLDPAGQAEREAKARAAKDKLNRRFG